MAKKISGRGRRRSREKSGNQGVGDFCFINILHLFSTFFSITLLYHFFCILFLPTTFTHIHDPRHLATLAVLSSYVNNTKRSIADNLCEVPAGSFEIFEMEKFRKKM